jgi:hypothetical protein
MQRFLTAAAALIHFCEIHLCMTGTIAVRAAK